MRIEHIIVVWNRGVKRERARGEETIWDVKVGWQVFPLKE
jgi:hypothetical protein